MNEDENALIRWADDGGSSESNVDYPALSEGTNDVYESLAVHQRTEDWDQREVLAWCQLWAKRYIFEFKLEISHVSLSVDFLRWTRLGHFRHGHNGFGLLSEVALNRHHFNREPWQILGTLLHELLHAEQEECGKPGKRNYHNVAFRRRAAEFGLIVDQRGYTQYADESRFRKLIERHGVEMPRLPAPNYRLVGESKMKLWRCACGVRVRVAVAHFSARCLLCDSMFVRQN